MAVVGLTVKYASTYGGLAAGTTVSNVQNIAINQGRQAQLDQYQAGTCQITLRYPTGYASPIAAFVPGQIIGVYDSDNIYSGFELFIGRIADVEVDYGIPYGGGVGPADYCILTCESRYAEFGRVQGLGYSMAAGTGTAQLAACQTQTGYNLTTVNWGSYNPSFAATTVNTTWGDWINQFVLTMNGRINENSSGLGILTQYSTSTPSFDFSDVASPLSGIYPYQQIGFHSLADNYYTQVTVTPESYAAQTVSSGSAPYRTYQVNTLNASTSQALDYANYLLSNYNTPTVRIASIGYSQNTQIAIQRFFPSTQYVGSAGTVTFRGTTYYCIIEGYSYNATPDQIFCTVYVSAQDLNAYLKLDNLVYGRLNYNKLGY